MGKLRSEARLRLQAIEDFTELGSGFNIAMRDMEIRGVGNILGSQQHGFMVEVGYELYVDLLKKAIQELKDGKVEENIQTEVKMKINAYLPDEYIGDKNLKIALYKQLSNIFDLNELKEKKEEFADRFGKMSEVVENLFLLLELKIYLSKAKVSRILQGQNAVIIEFAKNYIPSRNKIVNFCKKAIPRYEFFY